MRTRHKIEYVTGDGSQRIDFSDGAYVYLEPSFFEFERGFTMTEHVRAGAEITDRHRPPATHTMIVQIYSKDRAEFYELSETMKDIFALDWYAGRYGRITVNGWSIDCNITGCRLKSRQTLIDYDAYELTITCPHNEWYKRQIIDWAGTGSSDTSKRNVGKKYALKYAYRYGAADATEVLIDTVMPSAVHITIYGPAVNPAITIGDCIYQFPVTLTSGESVTVDGNKRLLYKTLATGEQINLFDSRPKDHDIFAKLSSGKYYMRRSGGFNAVIELINYRDTPKQEVRRWT